MFAVIVALVAVVCIFLFSIQVYNNIQHKDVGPVPQPGKSNLVIEKFNTITV